MLKRQLLWLLPLLALAHTAVAQVITPSFEIAPMLLNRTAARDYANYLKPFSDQVRHARRFSRDARSRPPPSAPPARSVPRSSEPRSD